MAGIVFFWKEWHIIEGEGDGEKGKLFGKGRDETS